MKPYIFIFFLLSLLSCENEDLPQEAIITQTDSSELAKMVLERESASDKSRKKLRLS